VPSCAPATRSASALHTAIQRAQSSDWLCRCSFCRHARACRRRLARCRGLASSGRIGLLPQNDPREPRSAVLVHEPDHPLWRVSTSNKLYSYLSQAFPQVDSWQDLVPESAARAFVESREGVFRHPQMTGRLVTALPAAEPPPLEPGHALRGLQGCAAVLLGDAAHVSPPPVWPRSAC
jgi:hypothetical protein